MRINVPVLVITVTEILLPCIHGDELDLKKTIDMGRENTVHHNERGKPYQTPAISWQGTTLNGSTFSDYNMLHAHWNYLYPWGSDHNGSARMYASATDHDQVYLSPDGVLNIKATKVPETEGKSSHDPWLPIRYHSSAVHAKLQVVINEQFPAWEVSGDFKAPVTPGTWPAFWITGANSWPPESDILEFKGRAVNWANTYDGGWETTNTTINDALSNWHNYKLVMYRKKNSNGSWSNHAICEYYIDGAKIGAHQGDNFFNQTFNIIINLQMEGASGNSGPKEDTFYQARNVIVRKGTFQ